MVGLATADARPNLHYDLINPADGTNYGCPTRGWRYDRTTMKRLIEEDRIIWTETPKQLINQVTTPDDIILDFFSGSATTAHAVMQLNAEDGGNRRYILVQLPEICDEKTPARIQETILKLLSDYQRKRLRSLER